jgi:hypothetical protein
VRLVWESLADRGDVKGYQLYRREGFDGPFRPLGGLVDTNIYIDRSAISGRSYQYRVTAIDDSPGANESAPSPEAAVLSETPEEAREAEPERPDFTDPGI